MVDALQRVRCLTGDITTVTADAIVNAASSALRGGGGVDGAIHRAAGPGLLAELVERYPEGCPTGEVAITAGHDLAARHVIHAVGPIWYGGGRGEAAALARCYTRALAVANEHGLQSLAFPAISAGIYGYPLQPCARVALSALREGLDRHGSIRDVRMILFSTEIHAVFERALVELREG